MPTQYFTMTHKLKIFIRFLILEKYLHTVMFRHVFNGSKCMDLYEEEKNPLERKDS